MTYQPKIQVFDNRKAIESLTNYLKAGQAENLLWANDGAPGIAPIKAFYPSARTVKIYPALSFIQSEHDATFQESMLIVDFSCILEVAIQHGKPDYLSENSPKYSMALESMLVNAPNTTFNENTKINTVVKITRLRTVFDVQAQQSKTKFLQIFQTSAQWNIKASLR